MRKQTDYPEDAEEYLDFLRGREVEVEEERWQAEQGGERPLPW